MEERGRKIMRWKELACLMKIGINALPLSRVRAGTARVIQSVIEELHKIDSENFYYLYSDRNFELPWEDGRWHKRIIPGPPFLPGTLWLQTVGRGRSFVTGSIYSGALLICCLSGFPQR